MITVTPGRTRRASGSAPTAIPASGVIPAAQTVNFLLGKIDHQLSAAQQAVGALLLLQEQLALQHRGEQPGRVEHRRAGDRLQRPDGLRLRAADLLHRLRPPERAARPVRAAPPVPHRQRGRGHRARDHGRAAWPTSGARSRPSSDAGFDFNQGIWQVLDNFSWIRGRHNFKVGVDAQFIDDSRVNTLFQLYTFPNVDAYVAARDGANPRSYTELHPALRRSHGRLRLELLRRSSSRTTSRSARASRSCSGSATTSSRSRTRGRSPPTHCRRASRSTRTTSRRASGSPGRSTTRRARCCARPRGSCTSRRC